MTTQNKLFSRFDPSFVCGELNTEVGAECWSYLELSELEDDESLLLRAGLRDLRRGEERGERPPLRGGDRRPDRDLECGECVKNAASSKL